MDERIRYIFEGVDKGLTATSNRVASSLSRVGTAAARADDRLDGLKFTAQAVGGRVGEMAGRLENLSRGLGKLGGPGAILAATAASAGALAVAASAGAAAIVGITRAAGEAVDSLRALQATGLGVPAEVVSRVERANTALDGIGFAAARLSAAVASTFGPAVEAVASLTTGLGLELADAMVRTGRVTLGLRKIVADLVGSALAPMSLAVDGIVTGLIQLEELAGGSTSKLRGFSNTQRDIGQVVVGDVLDALGDEADYLQQIIDRGRQAGEAVGRLADAERDHAAASREAAIAAKGGLSDAAQSKIRASNLAAEAEAVEQLRLQKIKDAAITGQTTEATREYTGSLSALAGVVGEIPGLFREQSKAAFIATKASALGQAIINTALAITAALGTGNPLQAALVGAAGAAQVATIAAQPPPSFDIGGVVQGGPQSPGGRPTQRIAQVEDGEVILSRRQQDALGRAPAPVVLVQIAGRSVRDVLTRSGALDGLQRRRGIGQRRYAMA